MNTHRCAVVCRRFHQALHLHFLLARTDPSTQEEGNVPYVVDGGFGVYTGMHPLKIADTVSRLFRNDDMLTAMSLKAKLLSHPEATMSIAKDIGETVLMKPVTTIRVTKGEPV